MRITAHGYTYTETEARQRIALLAKRNEEIGDSDGRVTEINALNAELAKAGKAAQDYRHRAFLAEEVHKAKSELAVMKEWGRRNEPAMHRIEYEDLVTGRRPILRHTTEDGFLKAIIRLYSNPERYNVIHVD
jgi:hypothetical protein